MEHFAAWQPIIQGQTLGGTRICHESLIWTSLRQNWLAMSLLCLLYCEAIVGYSANDDSTGNRKDGRGGEGDEGRKAEEGRENSAHLGRTYASCDGLF